MIARGLHFFFSIFRLVLVVFYVFNSRYCIMWDLLLTEVRYNVLNVRMALSSTENKAESSMCFTMEGNLYRSNTYACHGPFWWRLKPRMSWHLWSLFFVLYEALVFKSGLLCFVFKWSTIFTFSPVLSFKKHCLIIRHSAAYSHTLQPPLYAYSRHLAVAVIISEKESHDQYLTESFRCFLFMLIIFWCSLHRKTLEQLLYVPI